MRANDATDQAFSYVADAFRRCVGSSSYRLHARHFIVPRRASARTLPDESCQLSQYLDARPERTMRIVMTRWVDWAMPFSRTMSRLGPFWPCKTD